MKNEPKRKCNATSNHQICMMKVVVYRCVGWPKAAIWFITCTLDLCFFPKQLIGLTVLYIYFFFFSKRECALSGSNVGPADCRPPDCRPPHSKPQVLVSALTGPNLVSADCRPPDCRPPDYGTFQILLFRILCRQGVMMLLCYRIFNYLLFECRS